MISSGLNSILGLTLSSREPMEKPPLPPIAHRSQIALRLRATREALGLRPVDICRALGFPQNQYSQWESGRARPNLDDMIRFSIRYRIPLDWIYQGDPSGLPYEIAEPVLRSVQQMSGHFPPGKGDRAAER